MSARYFIVEGKSLATKRGVVAADDDNPEITVKCLVGDTKDETTLASAAARLEELCDKGYLVEADESPAERKAAREAEKAEKAAAEKAAAEAETGDGKATKKSRQGGKGGTGAQRAGTAPLGGPADGGAPGGA